MMKKHRATGKFLNNILFIVFLVMPFVTSIESHADNLNPATGDMRSETVVPDQFTGTASYSIPIKVPFGRNNMNPNLALTYRSTNGNGWLGVGWELEVGSIEKASKDVANLGTGFYLRKSGSALALFDNSAVAGAGSFSPVIEEEFNRIQQLQALDGHPYWLVTSKAGVTYRYGYTSASRQDKMTINSFFPFTIGTNGYTHAQVADPSNIFKWCLDQIQDTNGNTITYKYIKDQGQIYLDEIDYTANGTTIVPTNYVKFYRESGRFDSPFMFNTGFAYATALRLKTIDVVANGNRVRAYALGYNTATNTPITPTNSITGRSLLTSVTEYGSDAVLDVTTGPVRMNSGTFLPPISLGYQSTDQILDSISTGSGWTTNAWSGPTTSVPISNQCVSGDFNGDGLTDILCNQGNGSWDLYLSTGSGWSMTNYSTNFVTTSPLTNYCFVGDFYGAGASQLACYSASSSAWSVLNFYYDSSVRRHQKVANSLHPRPQPLT